jgi:hypothetical protein
VTAGRPSDVPAIGDWWELPSGRIVSIRRIEAVDGSAELVVRYVDEQGGMAQGEFNLAPAFVARGKKVGHD